IFKSDVIGTEHLLLAILRDEENIASQVLQQYNITYDIFKSEVEQNKTTITDEAASSSTGDDDFADDDQQFTAPKKVSDIKSDRKSTRLNSSHVKISYAVFCLKKKKN